MVVNHRTCQVDHKEELPQRCEHICVPSLVEGHVLMFTVLTYSIALALMTSSFKKTRE